MHRDSPISAIAPFSFKVDCELLSFIVKVQKRAGPSIDIVVVRRVDDSNLATLSEHGFMSLKALDSNVVLHSCRLEKIYCGLV